MAASSLQSPAPSSQPDSVTIIGAGLAGTLLAILLARRGLKVAVYERLPDMRREIIPAGRSINLALADRGIAAMEEADVMQQVLPLLIPMPGRLLHAADETLSFVPYGQREQEVIHSVSRPGLNRILLDAAEGAGVKIHFRHSVVDGDFQRGQVLIRDEATGTTCELPMQRIIAADGAGSPLRRALAAQPGVTCTEDLLQHEYKELVVAGRSVRRSSHSQERPAHLAARRLHADRPAQSRRQFHTDIVSAT